MRESAYSWAFSFVFVHPFQPRSKFLKTRIAISGKKSKITATRTVFADSFSSTVASCGWRQRKGGRRRRSGSSAPESRALAAALTARDPRAADVATVWACGRSSGGWRIRPAIVPFCRTPFATDSSELTGIKVRGNSARFSDASRLFKRTRRKLRVAPRPGVVFHSEKGDRGPFGRLFFLVGIQRTSIRQTPVLFSFLPLTRNKFEFNQKA